MLKEYCHCEDERMLIGKKRPTVMMVDAFERPEDNYKPKELKPPDPY